MSDKRSPGGILLLIGASFVFALLLLFLFSDSPVLAIRYFFTGPFLSRYYFGNMLDASVPLIFAGLGIAVTFKASIFNLGGEGQIYAGAIGATAWALFFPSAASVPGIFLALLAGALAGGVLAGISGVLQAKWNVDSMISSFLLSAAVIFLVDFLITGVLDDRTSSLLSTPFISGSYFLTLIFNPSTLSISILFALLTALFIHFLVFKTRWGYEMTMCGLNREFAYYGGIKTSFYISTPLVLSGVLHGLGGGMVVLGTVHQSIKGFTSGIGWSGIAVALIAGNNPLAVIPSALFFAYLNAGAKAAMLHTNITIETASVIQAFIFFFITSRRILHWGMGRK